MSGDFEYSSYPWPTKRGLLLLLNLPPNATKEMYEKAWRDAMTLLRNKTATQLFEQKVHELMRSEDRTFEDAWGLAKLKYKNLWRAAKDGL